MRHLSSPVQSTQTLWDWCLSTVGAKRALRLRRAENRVLRAERVLLAAAVIDRHRTITPKALSPKLATDLKWLYEKKVVGSDHYERIMHTTETGMCPFCGIARANTLDHSLPKSRYPLLAVTPSNLVPACRDCNFDKRSTHGRGNLSPYFDHWASSAAWLEARMPSIQRPEQLVFRVVPNVALPRKHRRALHAYFNSTNLDIRFATQAIDEFQLRSESWRQHAAMFGRGSLRNELEAEASRHKTHRNNGWQAAAYTAWATAAERVDW